MSQGHLISIIGGKGGVGKSVFASNLALSFLQEFKKRPMIVDLDFDSLGDQNMILGQNPPKNIVDLCALKGANYDLKTLNSYAVHASQGYSYLAAPREPSQLEGMDLDGLGKLLKALPQTFPLTIVDCGSRLDAHVLKALEASTLIFVVTTPDLMVIHQSKRLITKLKEMLFPQDMIQVVLNKVHSGQILSPSMIQKSLGTQIFSMIPYDQASNDSALAKNTPLCMAYQNSASSKAIFDCARKVQQSSLLQKLEKLNKPVGLAAQALALQKARSSDGGMQEAGNLFGRSSVGEMDAWTSMKIRIHRGLVETMDLKKNNLDSSDPKQKKILREKTQAAIMDLLSKEDTSGLLTSRELKSQMVKEVLDEALGLGPLEDLLSDESVTEIMVNARDQIYIERSGKLTMSKTLFSSEQQMMNVIERIVSPLGRRVDEKSPYVDARLEDGSRVHVIIPPLALRGPTITIRKFPSKRIMVKDLIQYGSMTEEIADFLRACVESALNIVVSGGTGSGKTTLLNVLSNFIPATERIITVEDSAELQLGQEHVVRLETRPKNIEGEGEVSIRDLIKCCLRMRPNRIVVGECRGGEALDMLSAMNTGHNGSLTTVHSNNPRECLQRLETLVMMSDLGLPSKAIRETIASAVNIVIQQSRLSDGSRKVTHISEITGMQGDVISLQDIFVFKQEGLDRNRKIMGRFVPTGFVPKFVEEMERKGLKISRKLFSSKTS